MSPLDAIWHILNFLAPAIFLALFSASAAKIVWGRSLRNMAWHRLLIWAMLPAIAVSLGGLILTGRDGSVTTYAAMVLAVAVGVWVGGFFSKSG